jgi:hypothetical protein
MERGYYIRFAFINGIYMPEQNERDVHVKLYEHFRGNLIHFKYTREREYIREALLLLREPNVNFTIWDFYNIIDEAVFED